MPLATEALVAVTGVLNPRPVTRTDGKEAARLPLEWRREVRDWFDQQRAHKFRQAPQPDHERTLDNLTRGIDLEKLAELHAALEPEAAAEYAAQLSNAREYVRERWPALALDTPTGPVILPPSLTEMGEACDVLAVIENPSRVLSELRYGTLSFSQVDAMAAVYPALTEMLRAMVQEEILRRRSRQRTWEMPWWQEQLWRILLQMPPDVPIAEVKQPPARAASPAPIEIEFRSQASKSERIAAL